MGLLWYAREKLGNCVLRVVYKTASPRANSGVYVRIADRPRDEWYAVHHGYEVQIMDSYGKKLDPPERTVNGCVQCAPRSGEVTSRRFVGCGVSLQLGSVSQAVA